MLATGVVGAVEDPWIRWSWVSGHLDVITAALVQHIQLTLIAVVVGLVIAVLIGVFVRDLTFGYQLSSILALLLAALGASVGVNRRAELAALFFGGGAPDQSGHRLTALLVDRDPV